MIEVIISLIFMALLSMLIWMAINTVHWYRDRKADWVTVVEISMYLIMVFSLVYVLYDIWS